MPFHATPPDDYSQIRFRFSHYLPKSFDTDITLGAISPPHYAAISDISPLRH
jgi:hypothetical protein